MIKRAFAIALLALGLGGGELAHAASLSAPATVPQPLASSQTMTPVYGRRGLWALPFVFGGAVLYGEHLRYEREHAACYHECRYDHSPVFCRHACW